MLKKLFTRPHLFFLLFLGFGQSQPGSGQDDKEDYEGDYDNRYRYYGTFTAVSSLFFRPGTDYKVFFTADPHPNPSQNNELLQLKCVLMANSSQSTTIESEPISLRPGESGQISIPLPRKMPGNETIWRLFAWSFTEQDEPHYFTVLAPHTLIFSSEIPNEHGQSVQKADIYDHDLGSIFIQMDKLVYKPDDLVRIRVITMGTDDLPHLTSGVNISITDSQGNVMKRWEQPLELPESTSVESNVSTNQNVSLFGEFQKKRNGLSSYEYQLSSEPILGNWEIQVEAGNIKEKMYFDVQKYILPKFQVKIHTPPVLYGSGLITAAATIKVSYTYGKGLQGTGSVTVTSNNFQGAPTKVQQIVVKDGETTVQLTFTSSSSYDTTHTITANVTEKNTGRWQIGKATVRIYPRETYSVEWINKQSSYKPGLPITVQLKVTGADGFPVKDVRANALRITFPQALNLPVKEISIPLSGIATFTIPTPLQPIPANSTFQAQYKRTSFDFPLPTAERGTSFGIFIDIISPPDTLNFIPGNSYNFTIRSNKPIRPQFFQCLLWDEAAMEVHGAQTIINNQTENATEFPFSLQIPKGPYDELKIFVYFEMEDEDSSQIISTFKSIKIVNNYLKIRVARPTPLQPLPLALDVEIAGISSTAAPTTTTEDFSLDYPNDGSGVAAEPQPKIGDKLQVEPGASVEIHFETYPNSTIAIRGIDQSLLLLTQQNGHQDNDLTQEKVESKRASSQPRLFHLGNMPRDTHFSCSQGFIFLKTFHRLGISVLDSKTFEPFDSICPTSGGKSFEEAEMAPPPNLVLDAPTAPQFDSRLRTKFPETWLWEDFQSSNDSSITVLSKTLPDTLTSWIISGFSLNPKTGLGVASPATITGFMPFFVTLNLPYSVIKQESFDLQVIVHNYLDRDVNVSVTLFNRHKHFDFMDSREIRNENATRSIKVQKNHAALTHFVITPFVIGEIPIEVKVVTEDGTAGDSMLRHLKVKPDGVRETRTQTLTFDSKMDSKNANSNLSREASFDVQFPKNVVEGASSLQLSVVGDPMATIVSQLATPKRLRSSSSSSSLGSSSSNSRPNLGHLLRIPSGCGEQNMIGLVPNILVLRYLKATGSDAKDVMERAKRNMEKGYGNQLQYRKSDDSFAVWQSSPGTTWLTSYVLRWFTVAQKYITVDQNVIRGAINFIRTRQREDGSFTETGPFYHPEMRGRTDSAGVALTAYTTLALIKANETSNNDLDLKVDIENGMNFISQESVYQLDDNYITNLVTATLIAGNHPNKTLFFEKMENGATATTNSKGLKVKFWDSINEGERASGPLAIEMTSYALLAHLWNLNQTDSSVLDIHRWLLSKRNPQGGFISSQDTVMGLTALTQFALMEFDLKELALRTNIDQSDRKIKIVNEDKLELKIRASSSGSRFPNSSTFDADSNSNSNLNVTELQVSVLRWNQMVLQEFELPVSAKKVSLYARGSGRAVVQMTQTWYVPTDNKFTRNPPDHFNITAKMRIPDPKEPSEAELRICVNSYHTSGARDSIASIQLPSGYTFSPEDYDNDSSFMKKRPGNVQRFELSQGSSKMDVYYTEIKASPPTCLSLQATQQFEVANAKNPVIHVYEYLDPLRKARIVYEPAHKITKCQLCQSTRTCEDEECV